MIKEAILKSVLIPLHEKWSWNPRSRIPNHLQLLHSQITGECDIRLCSSADAQRFHTHENLIGCCGARVPSQTVVQATGALLLLH